MNSTLRDWLVSNGKAALAAFLGAGLVALLQWVQATDFGPTFGPFLGAGLALGINAARKAVQEWLAPPPSTPTM